MFAFGMDRRRFVKGAMMLGAGLLSGLGFASSGWAREKTRVVVVKTTDRVDGVRRVMAEFDLAGFDGASVALKANYNSADPFPASTHPDTLRAVASGLKDAGAGDMTLVERSGMGETARVLQEMGATEVAREVGFEVVVMDDLGPDGYVHHIPQCSHWKKGILLERHFAEADKVVQTCCLKTHQYGGHFTMSLKNAVGAIAKYDPKTGHNFMSELHRSPLQRSLIAEISQVYRNDLIIMDGLKAFVSGGPHMGREVEPGVIVAGTDPVAVDAVGVAILRMYGTTPEVSKGAIFDQEQISRAAAARVGVGHPQDIDLVPIGSGADAFVKKVRAELA